MLNKSIVLLILGLLLCAYARSQEHFSRTLIPRVPTNFIGSQDVNELTIYYDGLGRPIQDIHSQGSPKNKDIIQHIYYDNIGRNTRQYLTYSITSSSPGSFRANPVGELNSFHQHEPKVAVTTYPYSRSVLESAPFGRLKEQGGIGTDRQPGAHTVTFTYDLNQSAEKVIRWKYNYTSSSLQFDGYYPAGELTANTRFDEHNNQTKEYINAEGQTVLVKSQLDATPSAAHEGWACTYTVYDDFNQPRATIPPEAVSLMDQANDFGRISQPGFVNTWLFLYEYDDKKRLVESKDPGIESQLFVYDQWDRPVLSQNGVQRQEGKWNFVKYDHLNRVIMTGVVLLGNNVTIIRNSAGNQTYRYEGKTSGNLGYTTNRTYPTAMETNVMTVTYYDDYGFSHAAESRFNFISELGHSGYNTNVKGRVTGNKERIIGDTNSWLRSVHYYDKYYRNIQSKLEDHCNGVNRTTNRYDFTGQLLEAKSTYSVGSPYNRAFVVLKVYEYDHAGRLINIYHQLGNNLEDRVLLASYEYNEFGQLVDKKLAGGFHGSDGYPAESARVFPQSVDYRYDESGLLTHINNSRLSNDGHTNDETNDAFGAEYRYNSVPGGMGSVPRYDGNVAVFKWNVNDGLNPAQERFYSYHYDRLQRLIKADNGIYSGTTPVLNQDYQMDALTYDLNGNILELDRNARIANREAIDQLDMTYSGNFLNSVEDKSVSVYKAEGFKDGNTYVPGVPEYTYDENGSLKTDKNKNISLIEYNSLDLPERIVFGSGDEIQFLYDAAGAKLQKRVTQGTNITTTDYIGEIDFVIRDGQISVLQIDHDEGRIIFDAAGNPDYEYFIRDHLGNVRTTFLDDSDLPSTRVEEAINFDFIYNMETDIMGGTNGIPRLRIEDGHRSQDYIKNGSFSMKIYDVHEYVRFNVLAEEFVDVSVWVYRPSAEGTARLTVEHQGAVIATRTASLVNQWEKLTVERITFSQDGSLEVTIEEVGEEEDAIYVYFDDLHIRYGRSEIIVTDYTPKIQVLSHQSYYPFGLTQPSLSHQQTLTYLATMEEEMAQEETTLFQHIDETRVPFGTANHTDNGSQVARLDQRNTIGPALALKVGTGDTLSLEAFGYYEIGDPKNQEATSSSVGASLAQAFSTPILSAEGAQMLSNTFDGALGAMISPSREAKKAGGHLNYLLFDEDYNFVQGGYASLSEDANFGKERISLDTLITEQPGYLYVYLSLEGESVTPVYFDDLKVTHHMTAPSGQTAIVGVASSSTGQLHNVYLYQGKEWLAESGLNLYDFHARLYDPALGRFKAADPRGELMPYNSPYVAMMNNPVYYIDPDGECPICVAVVIGAAIGAGSSAAIYTATSLTSGSFDWGNFGRSVLFGAVSGAISGGIGGAFANSAFAQTAGFSILNNTASTVAGTTILGGDITGGTVLGGVAGGIIGSSLPQFSGVKAGVLANIGAEIGYSSIRGGIIGAVGGGVAAAINGKNISLGIAHGAYAGAVGGGAIASLNIATMGPGIVPSGDLDIEDFGKNGPIFRRGSFLTRRGAGGVFGRNIIVKEYKRDYFGSVPRYDYNKFLYHHEAGHYKQEIQMGFAKQQGKAFFELLKKGPAAYYTPGYLENLANKYAFDRIGYWVRQWAFPQRFKTWPY